jgi:exosortase
MNKAKAAQSITPRVIGAWLLFSVTFAAAYYPVWSGLVRAWNGSDDYSHGFFIVPLALYMVWRERGRLSAQAIRGSWIGLPVVLISLFAYLFAQVGEILTLSSVSLVLFVWGAVIFLCGTGVFRATIYPLSLLFLMIPVPSQIYAALTLPLQIFVTKVTVWLVNLTGAPVFRDGNVIHLTERTFEVVQACSGLRSIMTLITLAAVLGFFTLKSSLQRGVLIASGIPIAIAVNIFRLFILVTAFQFLGLDLSEGTSHTILGLVVFAAALGLFMLVQRGLQRCEK